MERHRQIAAAPVRRASQTWAVISQLVVQTLDRSPSISGADVTAAMAAAEPAGTMLIAGGHLDRHPLVVVADPFRLLITTVSGAAAPALDENLAVVPGGAAATSWTIHLPTPEPIGEAVRAVARRDSHLSADDPPAEGRTKDLKEGHGGVDLEALRRRSPGS
jgi:hypothetical protein